MGLVIDTNVFIDAENGRLNIEDLDNFSNYGEAYIAAVTVSELLTAVHLAKKPDIKIQRSAFVEGVIARLPILEFNEEVARCYSELYVHSLKSKANENVNTHDLQIAATCIVHGFSLLTSGRILNLSHKLF